MIKKAKNNLAHTRVRFCVGDAEFLPLEDGAASLLFLSMVYHHIRNQNRAACEFRRVLLTSGFVCIRTSTFDLLEKVPYLKYFPSAMEFNLTRIPSKCDVIETMKRNGFTLLKHDVIEQKFADSLGEYYKKIRKRALSDLVVISDDEFNKGIHRMKEDVERNETQKPVLELIDLFSFKKGN